jgi:hypothetical protein
MRSAVSSVLALAALGCVAPALVREGAVAVRPRQDDSDSALVLSHTATVCNVTLRDESGRLHDVEQRTKGDVVVDMTRDLPNEPWRSRGEPPSVVTVLALPPGRYTLTEYSTSAEWDELDPSTDPPQVHTDCDASLTRRKTRLPLRIEPGKLTILDLQGGEVTFDTLRRMSSALHRVPERSALASWAHAVRHVGSAMHRELAARRRKPQNGYDLYPDCDGKLAVVRTAGKPFDWYARPDDGAARERFRMKARASVSADSVVATGFGNGCVKALALVYLLTDQRQLEPLARALGEMMVAEDLAGEIDLVLTGPVVNVGSVP